MSNIEFIIGCDPEFFLKDKETGKHVSAYDMIDGDKTNPLKVNKGAVQVDGMALEFNIDPARTPEEFDENICTVLSQLRDMIDDRYEFDFVPVAHFGKEYIDAQPEKARELGCEPDYNAYTCEANPRPNGDLGIRTAAGHIHIGWTNGINPEDEGHLEACRMLTRQLDYSLLIGSLFWDMDEERRSMYGQAGAFRPKHYGVEYRPLSNVWVKNRDLRMTVFNTTKMSAKNLLDGHTKYPKNAELIRVNSYLKDLINYIKNNNNVVTSLQYLYPYKMLIADYVSRNGDIYNNNKKYIEWLNRPLDISLTNNYDTAKLAA